MPFDERKDNVTEVLIDDAFRPEVHDRLKPMGAVVSVAGIAEAG